MHHRPPRPHSRLRRRRAPSSRCSNSPTTDGIHELPESDSTTGHNAHGIVDPMLDQRKRSPQVRQDNSYSGQSAYRLDTAHHRQQQCREPLRIRSAVMSPWHWAALISVRCWVSSVVMVPADRPATRSLTDGCRLICRVYDLESLRCEVTGPCSLLSVPGKAQCDREADCFGHDSFTVAPPAPPSRRENRPPV